MRPFAHADGTQLGICPNGEVDEVVPAWHAQRDLDPSSSGFEDPVREADAVSRCYPNCQTVEIHRVQAARAIVTASSARSASDVVGDRRSLGVKCHTGLIDDQHRMGAGIDGGTDLDEVRRSWPLRCRTRSMTRSTGAFINGLEFDGTDRAAQDIGPFRCAESRGSLAWARCARLAHRACDLILLADAGFIVATTASKISTPFGSLAADLRQRRLGKFF